jgi:hypothetical protein
MKLGIMQPYFFPYIGYFQLISAVDAFVLYDDVSYIKQGWINRNNILSNSESHLITLPLQDASSNKLINQIEIRGRHKILQNLRHSYVKAPYFDVIYPVIEDILLQTEKNLASFLGYQLCQVCAYLGLNPHWHISSELSKDNELRGQDKILAICEELGATHYINMPGGKSLYDQRSFTSRGLELSFIEPRPMSYRQFGNEFVPNLSIIDVLMFNDREKSMKLLKEFDLV